MNIQLGRMVFEFSSLLDWELHAEERFTSHGLTDDDVILVDSQHRICRRGDHITAAYVDGAFPVRAFLVRPIDLDAEG